MSDDPRAGSAVIRWSTLPVADTSVETSLEHIVQEAPARIRQSEALDADKP